MGHYCFWGSHPVSTARAAPDVRDGTALNYMDTLHVLRSKRQFLTREDGRRFGPTGSIGARGLQGSDRWVPSLCLGVFITLAEDGCLPEILLFCLEIT